MPVSAMRMLAAPIGDRPIILALVANSNFLPYLSRMACVYCVYRASVPAIGRQRARERESQTDRGVSHYLHASKLAYALARGPNDHPTHIPIVIGVLG